MQGSVTEDQPGPGQHDGVEHAADQSEDGDDADDRARPRGSVHWKGSGHGDDRQCHQQRRDGEADAGWQQQLKGGVRRDADLFVDVVAAPETKRRISQGASEARRAEVTRPTTSTVPTTDAVCRRWRASSSRASMGTRDALRAPPAVRAKIMLGAVLAVLYCRHAQRRSMTQARTEPHER